jgi:DNA-binding beta-propeller fold protein YncE
VRSPAGYDLAEARVIRLEEPLDEISGIAYDPNGPRLFAVNDEEGRIYTISLPDGLIKKGGRFAKGGDFEDIVLVDGMAYILKSNGHLYAIKNYGGDSMQTGKSDFTGKGRFDFETLFKLPTSNQLILLCKACPAQTNSVPGYSHDLANGHTSDTATFQLDFSALPDSFPLPGKSMIHPSGAAFNPITGLLFTLASANGLLIISDQQGVVSETYKLDKKVFKQPEGICFAPDGGLYVSNEAGTGFANILYFPFKGK